MLKRRSTDALSIPLIKLVRRQAMSTIPIRYTRRPANWKAAAPEPFPGTITLASQSALPKLPVPKLEDTLASLKESLKPVAWSDNEFAAAVKKIDELASGVGKELHSRLLKRAEETPHWLEEWWDDNGYNGYRDSVCPTRY